MSQQIPRGVPLDGARLRRLRQALGYTQEQLATKAECDAKTVRKAERSEPLDLATIKRLALALGADSSELNFVEPSDEAKLQVAWEYVRAFNERDPDSVAAIFHEDGSVNVMSDPGLPGGGLFTGEDGVREWARLSMDVMHMEQVSPEMVQVDVAGEYVLLRSRRDIRIESPRTQRAVTASVASEFRVRDGKVLSLRIFADTLAIGRLYQDDDESA